MTHLCLSWLLKGAAELQTFWLTLTSFMGAYLVAWSETVLKCEKVDHKGCRLCGESTRLRLMCPRLSLLLVLVLAPGAFFPRNSNFPLFSRTSIPKFQFQSCWRSVLITQVIAKSKILKGIKQMARIPDRYRTQYILKTNQMETSKLNFRRVTKFSASLNGFAITHHLNIPKNT